MFKALYAIIFVEVAAKVIISVLIALEAMRMARWIPSRAWSRKRAAAIVIGIAQLVAVVWLFLNPAGPTVVAAVYHGLELAGFYLVYSFLGFLADSVRHLGR